MQRYFAIDEKLNISSKDKHHIINVMRMKVNDEIKIVYDSRVYLCKIDFIDKNDVKYNVIKEEIENNELNLKITFAIPLVNEQKLDFILQKCTELGVYDFIIFNSERSKIKINDKINKKIDRWNLITKEAAEQSFRNVHPIVYGVMNLEELTKTEHNLKLVSSTKKIKKSIKNVLQNSTYCDKIIIVVGPEGGLTENEEEYFLNNGFEAITLGDTILRCETAPIFIMSAIKYELMR